jgi:Tol biopolymer transport system component
MADERLIRSLRVIDTAVAPRREFVEDLRAILDAELGFTPSRVPRTARPAVRRRAVRRRGMALIAAAALLIAGLLALGIVGQRTPKPPTTSPSPTASGRSSPSTPLASGSAPAASAPLAPSLLAVRGAGRVVYEAINTRGSGERVTRLRTLVSDRSAPELLPDIPGVQDTPAWSHDGTRLAFSGYDPSEPTSLPTIYETDVDGSTPRRIDTGCSLPACLGDTDPAYAPDGTKLAFVRTDAPAGDTARTSVLAVIDLRTGSVVEFEATRTDAGLRSHRHPSWSPDGSQIAFGTTIWSASGFGAGSIVSIIGSDGTGRRQLTDDAVQGGDPDWSSDGSTILFSSHPVKSFCGQLGCDPALMHVFLIRPDGTDLRQLDSGGQDGSASWSADESQILFARTRATAEVIGPWDVMVMERDGSDVRPVSVSVACCRWYPVQQPSP